jgi:lipopolysaccharide transport protein LptA
MRKPLLLCAAAWLLSAAALHAQGKAMAASGAAAAATPPADQPIITVILADQSDFDASKRIGIFTGHVKVSDPRFQIQSDKLTVYIHKEENEGLEKAVAEGNVGVIRDRPDPDGGPPTRSVGLSSTAVYTSKNGNVELTGNPRVQQGINTHVATNPGTVMILNESGQLVTKGPSRTEIRQPAKTEPIKK